MMNLNDGEFETEILGPWFEITISKESDWSVDGGYSFETVVNSIQLSEYGAKELMFELRRFIERVNDE